MAKTYQQLMEAADALRARADMLRQKEAIGVIARIKVAIAHYGLTAGDLGFEATSTDRQPAAQKAKPLSENPGSPKARQKFRDANGRSWSGMGPRPAWLKAALAAGKSIEDFMTDPADAAAPPALSQPKAKSKSKSKSKMKLPAKYRDEAGNTWSGRGSTPRWLRAMLAAGKTLEDLAV